jgi:hypothetical protein
VSDLGSSLTLLMSCGASGEAILLTKPCKTMGLIGWWDENMGHCP